MKSSRVALYARISRHDKEQNPENQLMKLREFANRHDWSVYGEYIDIASGAHPSRPNLDKMLKDARSRRFDAILVNKLDRVGRSALNLLEILRDLNHYGVGLICTDQPIDTTTPMGKMIFTVLSAMAEFERELISDRTKDGLARARAQGKQLGRPRYPVTTDEILKLRNNGLSYRQIAEKVGMSHQGVKKRLRLTKATKRVEKLK